MSLLDNAKKEAGVTETAPVATEAKKKHNNSDYQKRAREKALASAQLIKKELESKKFELSAAGKEALAYLCKEGRAAGSSNFGTPVFNKLFGDAPKVGDKITSLKVFETTGKGFAEMRKLIKQWKEKNNTVVEYDEASKAYVIKSM